MLTQQHRTNDLHDAGYRPRWMKSLKELNGYVFKAKASHLNGGHQLWSGMERGGLRYATLPKTRYMKMIITTRSVPARSSPEQGPHLPLLAIRTEMKSMRLMEPHHDVPETTLLLAPGM